MGRRWQPGREQQFPHRSSGQAAQVHPLSVGIRRQPRQEPGAHLTGRRRVPVSREHQDGRPPQLAHHIGKQDRRRLIRPLQIVKHQQEPAWPSRPHQPPANLGEQREPLGAAGAGAIGQHRALGITKTRDHRSASGRPSSAPRTAGSSSTSRHRPYGGELPASAARAHATGTPLAAAFAAVSSASRVFPIPASPVHSTKRPRPDTASSSSRLTRASSRSRPTSGPDAPPSTPPIRQP